MFLWKPSHLQNDERGGGAKKKKRSMESKVQHSSLHRVIRLAPEWVSLLS